MNIVSRVQFPQTADVSDLYIKFDQGAFLNDCDNQKQITFLKDGALSLNSYFNSVYENFYLKYTNLSSIYYLLKLEGDFQVSIYRELYGIENRELIFRDNFEKCHLSDSVKIFLPNPSQKDTGRVYLEIMCLSESGLFTEGVIVSDQDQTRQVSLCIITCTFRKEVYIKNTVNTILEDTCLKHKNFKIVVVDNGKTLKENDFKDSRVQLLYNRNVGGSGGFTRGLIEALREDVYTHFLFMDDDIELDSESVYRLISLYEYAKHDFAVAGSMLDIYKKHILHEAGASYDKLPDCITEHPFLFACLKHNLNLENSTFLNILLVEENFDFGGFWFFSFSREVVKKIGLPMPFFIKLDDTEFCLRLKQGCGCEIVAFPSIAVWHQPFYAKAPIWDTYYYYRNHLITHSIHGSLEYGNAVKYLTKILLLSLLIFDYNSAAMVVKAFEDYMEGPAFIKKNDPEVLHSKILELSKSYKSQNVQRNYSLTNCFEPKSNGGSLKKLVSLLTLNGHLLPNFLITDCKAFIQIDSGYSLHDQWYKAFAKKRVVVFREKDPYFNQNEIDKLAGLKLLSRWFKVASISSIKWSSVSAEWKNASSDFTSIEFWHQYLGLEEQS